MNKVFSIFIAGLPLPQPRPRGRTVRTRDGRSFVQMYESSQRSDGYDIKDWKNVLNLAFNPLVPNEPLVGPLRCDMAFYFPRPQYMIDKPRYPDHPLWHDHRPDKDNLEKAVLDCMTAAVKKKFRIPGFFNDDGQVASGLISKFFVSRNPFDDYGKPGVRVTLYELFDEDLPHVAGCYRFNDKLKRVHGRVVGPEPLPGRTLLSLPDTRSNVGVD